MHLVVLRRNNIPIPSHLPSCLQPQVLSKALGLPQKEITAEADLLHLESDDNQDVSATSQRVNASNKNEYQRMISSTYDDFRTTNSTAGNKSNASTIMNKSSTLPKNHFSSQNRGDVISSDVMGNNSNNINNNSNIINNNNLNLNLHNNNNKQMNMNVINTAASANNTANAINRSGSNSPTTVVSSSVVASTVVIAGSNAIVNDDGLNSNKEWTKFTESPTSNLSSPGPKPVNVTQSIVSDPSHVIHPVPLRVTPVVGIANEIGDDEALRTFRKADTLVFESGVMKTQSTLLEREASPRHHQFKKQLSYGQHQRESLPTDLRAIQRPHPKKPASKNIGQIPMPPENSNINNGSNIINNNSNNQVTISGSGSTIVVTNKKEIPPIPPPR
jgi:hypothetical protein